MEKVQHISLLAKQRKRLLNQGRSQKKTIRNLHVKRVMDLDGKDVGVISIGKKNGISVEVCICYLLLMVYILRKY